MNFFTVIFLIFFAQEAVSQVFLSGQCPTFKNPIEKSFDFNKFAGLWFGIKQIPIPATLRCIRGFYRNYYNGTFVAYDTGYDKITGKPGTATFYGRIFKGPNMAFRYLPTQTLDEPNFIAVGIDYKSWVAIISCKNLNATQYGLGAVIYSRKYPMDQAALKKGYAALKHAGVDLKLLGDYDQKNCTYGVE